MNDLIIITLKNGQVITCQDYIGGMFGETAPNHNPNKDWKEYDFLSLGKWNEKSNWEATQNVNVCEIMSIV